MPFGLHVANVAPTALYALGWVAFAASASGRPHLGVYYLVPLLPLQKLRYHIHELPLGSQWIDIMLIGAVIGIWRSGHPVIPRTRLTKLLVILTILTYISLWRGSFYLDGPLPLWFDEIRVSNWKNYVVIPFLFFVVLGSIRNMRQAKVLLILMFTSALLLNRTYINNVSGRDFSHFSYEVRDEGPIGYAGVNGLAAFEAQIGVFLLGLFACHKERWPRLGYLLVIFTCLYALLYTLSRGGYAALLVGIAFIGVLKSRLMLLIVIGFLVVWQSFVPTAVVERVAMTSDSEGEMDHSAGVRLILWENAIETFRTNPIFGTGFDTYEFMNAVGPYRDTHNVYVKILLETGLVGIGVFLIILAKMFGAGYRLFRAPAADGFAQGLGLGLAGLIVAAAVGNFFGDRWSYIELTGYTFTIAALVVRCESLLSNGEDDAVLRNEVTADDAEKADERMEVRPAW